MVLTKFFIDEPQSKIIANLLDDDFKKIHGGDIQSAKLQYISRIKNKSEEFILNNSTMIEKTKTVLFEDSIETPKDGILITRDLILSQKRQVITKENLPLKNKTNN